MASSSSLASIGVGIDTSITYQINNGPGITFPAAVQPANLPASQVSNWNNLYAQVLGLVSQPQVMYTRSGPNLTVNPLGTPGFDQSIIPTYNVYFSDTQYYDSAAGNILYSSAFDGTQAIVDTTPYPANGCRDSYTSICLSDGQIQSELASLISSRGLPSGTGVAYFMFTPKGVGSCAGTSCAFSYYCAYHSNFATGGHQALYANMPYANTVPAACGSGQSPNGSGGAGDADSTLNVTSHEHNEAVTDPLGTAWFDRSGYENGDKCAWNFGTALGSTSTSSPSTTKYNQLINGHAYYLQQEWSNARPGCVLTGT